MSSADDFVKMSFDDDLNTMPQSDKEKVRQVLISCVTLGIVDCVRKMCRTYAQEGKHHLVGLPVIHMRDIFDEDGWKEMDDFCRMFIGTSAERRAAMARCAHKGDYSSLYSTRLDSILYPPSNFLNDYSIASTVRDIVARELGKDGFSTCSVTLLEGHNVKQHTRESFFGGKKHFSYEEAPGTFYVIHVDVSW